MLISVFSLFDMDEVLRVPICTQPVCVGGTTCPTNFILLCVMHIQLDNKYYTFALAFSTQSNFLLRQQFSLESICCKYISVHREGRNSRRSGRITNTSPHTAFNWFIFVYDKVRIFAIRCLETNGIDFDITKTLEAFMSQRVKLITFLKWVYELFHRCHRSLDYCIWHNTS